MPELINSLIERGINFHLDIAGDGDFKEIIEEYVNKRGLFDRVSILGLVQPDKMGDFWKRQHVYINLSEYEGTSLAMLQAMSMGCVPVVTNVSGAEDVICSGENGYIVDIGDIKGITEKIYTLEKDEAKRRIFSQKCSITVRDKCDFTRYMDRIEREIINSEI